ncbi:MAG: C1 family peptidase, partial [Candidatus Thermoplasmatota archaeon]|nr:C1 family peptidase [Candidatus Thermoplasmatota archaeon]
MKKQTRMIGIASFLFLLVVFSYINVESSYPHDLLMEEKNNTLIQKINLVASGCNVCETEDNEYEYTIMRPDSETLAQWIEHYNSAPKAISSTESETQMKATLGSTNFSLLSHLEYAPDERNQGSCGNCWAWAGTGVLGIALDVQEGIKDRLSVQYINSCESSVIGISCCGGGWLCNLTDFYESTSKTIPWSNTNASWQDGDESCNTSCSTISTNPGYPITSINEETIITHNVTNATAIANIKTVLNQNRAVWFGFFLPTNSDWNNFFDFWNNDNETDIWDPDYSCGHVWVNGGGHAVLCVGYNDEDPNNKYWIMLNSWGNSTDRPNGLFRVDMDMNYDCYHYNPHPSSYYSFYWQTLNVTFDIEIPEVVTNTSTNVEETTATLRGTLLNNGSSDTTCYFLWNTTDDFESPIGNESIGIMAENELFSYNI